MGTSVSEDIALRVVTTADLGGTTAVRGAVGALARETEAAAATIVAATEQATQGQETLAKATNDAAAEQSKFTVSAEVMRSLLVKAGGDMNKLKELLRSYVGDTQKATEATKQQGAEDDKEQQRIQRRGMAMAAAHDAALRMEAARVASLQRESNAQQENARKAVESAERQQASLQREGMAMAAMRDQALQMNDAYDRQRVAIDKIPAKARTAANSLSTMAYAATSGQGSAHALAVAAGAAADGIAVLSTNAKIAASAAGIGAIVTILASAYFALRQFNVEAKAGELSLARTKDTSTATIDRIIADQRARTEAARSSYQSLVDERGLRGSVGPWSAQGRALRDYQAQLDALNAMEKARRDLLQQQRVQIKEQAHDMALRIAEGNRSLEIETLRTYQLKVQAGWFENLTALGQEGVARLANQQAILIRQAELENESREQAIRESFRQVDAHGREIVLTKEQRDLMDQQLVQSRERLSLTKEQIEAEDRLQRAAARNALRLETAEFDQRRGSAFDARLEQIEAERRAEIAKTGDVEAANERAELKIRQLRKQTVNAVISDLGTIAGATIDSQNRTIRALGHGADTLRKVMIGAQAAHAAVEAAIEWGKSIGSLASGDFRGAGLHTASAIQLTAAAALGARESLGGGGGSAGSGGGVGPQYSSRDPREAPQSTTVIIQTINPFSREVIGETSYQLGRAGMLKTPIYAPPTSRMVPA